MTPIRQALAAGCAVALAAAAATRVDAQRAPVTVLNAEAEKVTFANVTQPVVRVPITIENAGNAARANVSLLLGTFTNGAADTITPKVSPEVVTVPARGRADFTVEATFLPAGTFVAYGRVMQGNLQLATFRMEIVRTRAAPPVDLGVVPAIQTTAAIWRTSLSVPLPMKLYATGAAITVPPPALHSAIRKLKADSPAGVAATATLDVGSSISGVRVEPGVPKDLAPTLTGIGSPGRYDLKLRVAPAGYEVIEKDVTVYVRDPAWVAGAVILGGVLLSLALLMWARVRPLKVVQRRVERVLHDLQQLEDSELTPAGRDLVQTVTAAIKVKWDRARNAGEPLAPDIVTYEVIVAAVRRWDSLAKQRTTLRPVAVRQFLDLKLDEISRMFRAEPPDAVAVTTASKTLQDLPDTVRKKVAETLRIQLKELDAQLQVAASPDATRIRSLLTQVGHRIDDDALEAAIGAFDSARLLYALLLADDLDRRASATTPPAGVQSDWARISRESKEAAAQTKKQTNADDAMEFVGDAVKNHLYAILAALKNASKGLEAKAQPITDLIGKAELDLAARRFSAAWADVEDAHSAYLRITTPAAPAATELVGGKMGPGPAGAAAGGGALIGALDSFKAAFASLPYAADLDIAGGGARTQAWITTNDLIASMAVVVVATAIGLQVLWADNPTWGGWLSYLAALTWGFGLDQFTHAGIAKLRPK